MGPLRLKWPLVIPSYSMVSGWLWQWCHRVETIFSWHFKYQLWRSFFYFRVVALLWELMVLFWEILNCCLPSWYPSMALAQQTSYKSNWACKRSLGGNVLAYIWIVQGHKNSFLAPWPWCLPSWGDQDDVCTVLYLRFYSFMFIPLPKDSEHHFF